MEKLHIDKGCQLPNQKTKAKRLIDFNKLSYDQLLDVANAVEMGMRGFNNVNVVDPKSRAVAQKVLLLYKNPDTIGRSNLLLQELNREIIKKNAQISKGQNGTKLYNDLMNNR